MIRTLTISLAALTLLAGNASAAVQPPATGAHLGNVLGGDFKPAQAIIEKRCTACHTRDRIDAALSAGKDMRAIQRSMEKRGAKLNAKERDVLGIYWGKAQPLKTK